MSEHTITFYVERGGVEIELEITGDVTPRTPARRHGHPDTWSPAEGGEVEITGIMAAPPSKGAEAWGGALSTAEEERAQEALEEAAGEDNEPDYDASDEGDYDRRD